MVESDYWNPEGVLRLHGNDGMGRLGIVYDDGSSGYRFNGFFSPTANASAYAYGFIFLGIRREG